MSHRFDFKNVVIIIAVICIVLSVWKKDEIINKFVNSLAIENLKLAGDVAMEKEVSADTLDKMTKYLVNYGNLQDVEQINVSNTNVENQQNNSNTIFYKNSTDKDNQTPDTSVTSQWTWVSYNDGWTYRYGKQDESNWAQAKNGQTSGIIKISNKYFLMNKSGYLIGAWEGYSIDPDSFTSDWHDAHTNEGSYLCNCIYDASYTNDQTVYHSDGRLYYIINTNGEVLKNANSVQIRYGTKRYNLKTNSQGYVCNSSADIIDAFSDEIRSTAPDQSPVQETAQATTETTQVIQETTQETTVAQTTQAVTTVPAETVAPSETNASIVSNQNGITHYSDSTWSVDWRQIPHD